MTTMLLLCCHGIAFYATIREAIAVSFVNTIVVFFSVMISNRTSVSAINEPAMADNYAVIPTGAILEV